MMNKILTKVAIGVVVGLTATVLVTIATKKKPKTAIVIEGESTSYLN